MSPSNFGRFVGWLDDTVRRWRNRRRWAKVPMGTCPHWIPGSWTASRWVDSFRHWVWARRTGQAPNTMGSTLWPGPLPVPQVCSYDGGVHPEDAIRLVRAGWTVQGTDKSYKRYLDAPTGCCNPIPPIKVYVDHFDADQIRRFNQAIP